MAKLHQLHLLLMIRFHKKMTGLQHMAAVDEAPVVREEAGEVDTAERVVGTAEKQVDEDMVEIVVAVALIVVEGMASSEDVERVIVVGEMVSGGAEAKATEEGGTDMKVTEEEVTEMKATGEGETDMKATEEEETDTKVTVAVGGVEVKGVVGPLLNHNRGTY